MSENVLLPKPLSSALPEPAVGIFWFVNGVLVAVGVAVSRADRYGDCLTYDGGHAELWEAWSMAGPVWLRGHALPAAILSTEYDAHPRGRVIFDERQQSFMIYADRRLQRPAQIALLQERFGLKSVSTTVLGDSHYR